MIKTLIIIAIVVAVALGGWQIFEYWEKVSGRKRRGSRKMPPLPS